MKNALMIGLLLCAISASGAHADDNAASRRICLDASSVESTGVIDNRTIIFNMRGGKVWKNTLKNSCPTLKFQHGFAEVVRSGVICANQQIITVLGTGNTCQLGDFTPVTMIKPQAN